MTIDERNTVLEASDILKYLGGNNGVTNLQPKVKHQLVKCAAKLKKIVEDDIKNNKD